MWQPQSNGRISACKVHAFAYLPEFKSEASKWVQLSGGSGEKNKVGDTILPPVVRTEGLMRVKKSRGEQQLVPAAGLTYVSGTRGRVFDTNHHSFRLLPSRFFIVSAVLTISFSK